MEPAKYYVVHKTGTKAPIGLFRFFEDDREPEYYKIGQGWIADRTLYSRRMSGEIDESDVIPEADAQMVINEWTGGR